MVHCHSLSTYQSCRLKLNLDLISSIVIAPLHSSCQTNTDSDDYPTHARLNQIKDYLSHAPNTTGVGRPYSEMLTYSL